MCSENKRFFISYSSKNTEEVKELVDFVESTTGRKCWYSERDLDKSRSDWPSILMEALANCDKVILYLTKETAKSGEVENEIANASAKGICIVPLLMQDFKMPEKFNYFLRKYEWIPCFQLEESSYKDILRKRLLENYNEEREQFWKIVKTKEFVDFVKDVMHRYYGSEFFVNINDKEFGVFCIRGKDSYIVSSIKDYDCLCDLEGSQLSAFEVIDHQSYKENKWYPEYSRILEGKIRFPDRPGYMLDEIITDEKDCFDKIQVHVGTFAENVYSTHVLEYELYRAFLQFSDKDLNNPEIWEQLKHTLTIRNSMHRDVKAISGKDFVKEMRTSLLKGYSRNSLLSVQMLVIIKSKRSNNYEVKIIQRSNNVAIKPGIYQFIPSGGFEILNDSDDDVYDDIELVENFSPGCAIFREYLEELFNVPEFEGGGNGSVEERLLKDDRIRIIEKLLTERKAEFHFLGSVIDLAGLRHELSFAFIIHDDAYSENQFVANEECKKGIVRSYPIQDFDKIAPIWKNIHAPSAAMWYLFQNTEIYKSLIYT